MQFDILNELVTSTVFDLFTNTQNIAIQCKPKVKQLQGLIKNESITKRNSNLKQNDSFSILSDASRQSSSQKVEVIKYKTISQWMEKEAPKRLKESFKKLGLQETLMNPNKKIELQQYIDTMSVDSLANEKKKVKNQLKSYDNDFHANFKKQPNHQEKQPLRKLYVYYKKLKEGLTKKGGQQLSQQKIETMIANIKKQRRQLREQIQAYQKQFELTNNRRIRYVRDISPIDNQYKKYKELKNQLLRYEEMLNK